MTINNKSILIYCDGGARGNPGPAACAFIVTDENGRLIQKQGFYMGIATNNQAEYQAVIEALKWLSNQVAVKQVTVNFYLDSQLVINQLNGLFKVKDPSLKIKNSEIKELISNLLAKAQTKFNFQISNFVYVPRAQNAASDLLVNQTLDKNP